MAASRGRVLHAEAFEALVALLGRTKRAVAVEADVSPSLLSELIARRARASARVVERLAATLRVAPAVIFPEVAGWTAPSVSRRRTRGGAS